MLHTSRHAEYTSQISKAMIVIIIASHLFHEAQACWGTCVSSNRAYVLLQRVPPRSAQRVPPPSGGQPGDTDCFPSASLLPAGREPHNCHEMWPQSAASVCGPPSVASEGGPHAWRRSSGGRHGCDGPRGGDCSRALVHTDVGGVVPNGRPRQGRARDLTVIYP